jgi:hypothetical protein|tara:strand:+ start:67 stop:438 length:372 start_codon:yes stop_codon:yes gene_type:complete
MNWLIVLSLKSILSSIIGSSFYKWFEGTTVGIWFQKKVDTFMQYLAVKYDLELAKKDAKFRKQYPLIADKLDILESMAHHKCGLEGFDDYQPMIDRLDSIEEDMLTLYEVHARQIAKHLSKPK